MIKKIKEKISEYWKKAAEDYHEILNSDKTSHHYVALGFAIGTFIAILPTPGINIILSAIIAFIFKKLNKLSLFFSLFFWNPVFMIPIYYLSHFIGKITFGSTIVQTFEFVILNQIYNYSRRLLFGLIICALFFSIISYFAIRIFLHLKQNQKSYTKKDNNDFEHYEHILESQNIINDEIITKHDDNNYKNKKKINKFIEKHSIKIVHDNEET